MPTRMYFSDAQAAAVTPAFGAWGESDGAVRRKLLKAKEAGEALALGTRLGWVAGQTQLDRQFVSDQMAAGNVFTSATVKLQLATREFAVSDNSTSRLEVKIVSSDGNTVRQTLLALGQFGPVTEYINNASLRNKTFADGDAVSGTYTTVADDRLVVEIGHTDGVGGAGTTPEGQCRFGAPSGTADHAENETETTSLVGWVELSNVITWAGQLFTQSIVATSPGVASVGPVATLKQAVAATSPGVAALVAAGFIPLAIPVSSPGVAAVALVKTGVQAIPVVAGSVLAVGIKLGLSVAVTSPAAAALTTKQFATLAAVTTALLTLAAEVETGAVGWHVRELSPLLVTVREKGMALVTVASATRLGPATTPATRGVVDVGQVERRHFERLPA